MQRYLQRLDAELYLDTRVYDDPSLNTLRDLVTRHLQTVPFENIDIIDGVRRPLSTAGVLEKVVNRSRGGFCYELNEAFAALLTHLRFAVRRIEARVWSEQRQKFGAPFDHLALIVSLTEGEFLVDVGFGDINRTPLRLPEDTQTDISGAYFLTQSTGAVWQLSRGDQPLYEMTLQEQPLSAFEPMYIHHQTSPESAFTQGLICTKATPSGRITLSRDRLIIVDGHARTETEVSNRQRALEEHFGIATQLARLVEEVGRHPIP